MKIKYTPKHFKVYELVPESIYKKFGDSALRFFDDRILITADRIREKYGKMVCNNWFWGGEYDSRGFRPPDDKDGAELSAHKRAKHSI